MTHPCATCNHAENMHTTDPVYPLEDTCQECGDSFDPEHDWTDTYPYRECEICGLVTEAPEPTYDEGEV